MIIALILVSICLAGALCALAIIHSSKASLAARLTEMERANTQHISELKTLHERQIAELKDTQERQISELKAAHDDHLRREHEATGERFAALAADALQRNSRQLDERARLTIEAVLSPVKANLEEFEKSFRECYTAESLARLAMREEISRLAQASEKVEREAGRLTTALRGNTGVQGRWGEMVLKNILEHSGLESGRWLVTQASTTDDAGTIRPDAIIHCPDNRDIIIDSKVNLTAYFDMLEAEKDTDRSALLKKHVEAVERQVRSLGSKEYHNRVGARNGDFVFMFMPHEGAYISAINASPQLWETAFANNVVLVSPTHLVTAIRLVVQMWRSEDQSANIKRIVEKGQLLANSIVAFMNDIEGVYQSIDALRSSFDSAVKRFYQGNNNLVHASRELASMGIRPKGRKGARTAPQLNADVLNRAGVDQEYLSDCISDSDVSDPAGEA